jgi:hypothetical protein
VVSELWLDMLQTGSDTLMSLLPEPDICRPTFLVLFFLFLIHLFVSSGPVRIFVAKIYTHKTSKFDPKTLLMDKIS